MTRLPHRREPNKSDPDVCIDCHEPWCDLLTGRDADECSARLRTALSATLAVTPVQAGQVAHHLSLAVRNGLTLSDEARAGLAALYAFASSSGGGA